MTIERHCKYCGRIKISVRSLATHEYACPEMRYFAEFALRHSGIDERKFNKLFGPGPQAFISGIRTKDERIVNIVRRFARNRER